MFLTSLELQKCPQIQANVIKKHILCVILSINATAKMNSKGSKTCENKENFFNICDLDVHFKIGWVSANGSRGLKLIGVITTGKVLAFTVVKKNFNTEVLL